MRRLRILVVAYACDPTKGSESGVGWGWVNAISAEHDVTVITADYNRTNIERILLARDSDQSRSPRFHYVRNRPWHYYPGGAWLKIENSIAKPIMNLAYQNWLHYAFLAAKAEADESRYDVLHLITYVGWRFPGRFYRLGIPFVWGPIGGMKNTPWKLLPVLGLKGAIYYGARNLVNSLQLNTLLQPRKALRAAAGGVIAATSEIQDELWKRFRVPSRVISEVGPPSLTIDRPSRRNADETFRICWSGMHLPGKALHLLLRAVAKMPTESNLSIEILGDGPMRRNWQSLANDLGIGNRCHWHGWLPREESLATMKNSHVFVITSLKDLTSTVAVEAISLGLPIVSLDHCGFADLVTEDCGIKIRLGSANKMIMELADSIRTLYMNEELRRCLAKGALIRSKDYAWQLKMERLNEAYNLVLVR